MSLLNLFFTPQRAWIAADTQGQTAEGLADGASKLLPLPGINAVLGFRGHMIFANCVFLGAHFSDGLDKLIAHMPQLCKQSLDYVQQEYPQFMREQAGDEDIVLVGWSKQRMRVVAHFYHLPEGAADFAHYELECSRVAPWDESMSTVCRDPYKADLRTDWEHERLARAQVKLIQEKAPGGVGGGRLILITLDERGMQIRPICDLDHSEDPMSLRAGTAVFGAAA